MKMTIEWIYRKGGHATQRSCSALIADANAVGALEQISYGVQVMMEHGISKGFCFYVAGKHSSNSAKEVVQGRQVHAEE